MVTERAFSFFRRNLITSVAHTYWLLLRKQLPRAKTSIENIFFHLLINNLLISKPLKWSRASSNCPWAIGWVIALKSTVRPSRCTLQISSPIIRTYSNQVPSMTLSLLAHYFSEKSKFSDFLTLRRGVKKRDSNGPFVIVAALQTDWRTAVPLSAAGRLGIIRVSELVQLWDFPRHGLGASWSHLYSLSFLYIDPNSSPRYESLLLNLNSSFK